MTVFTITVADQAVRDALRQLDERTTNSAPALTTFSLNWHRVWERMAEKFPLHYYRAEKTNGTS